MRENARFSEIEEYDGRSISANARDASEISDVRQYTQQTITLTTFDDTCVRIVHCVYACLVKNQHVIRNINVIVLFIIKVNTTVIYMYLHSYNTLHFTACFVEALPIFVACT